MLQVYSGTNGYLTKLVPEYTPQPETVVWVDLFMPTAEEVKKVEQYLDIELPTRDEMAEIELSDRLYRERGAIFMTMTTVVDIESEHPVKMPITFILKAKTLITVRHVDPRSFTSFITRMQRPGAGKCSDGEFVLIELLESIIDRIADALEMVGDQVDGISQEVFRNKNTSASKKTHDLQSLIEEIGHKGDLITKVRETLVSLSRLVTFYNASEGGERKIPKDIRQRLRLVLRDSTSLGEQAVFLSGNINFLLDATLGLINLEQNQIIKIFSVAAVVFLPPTLIASIYGMNFHVMPELSWEFGYPFAIGLMIVSAIMPYLYFKRRGWL